MITKKLLAASGALALAAGICLATPAQAIDEPPVGPGAVVYPGGTDIESGWTWSVAGPAEFDTEAHEVAIGLSDVVRTVTLHGPVGAGTAKPEVGDTWRIYNGYFSAEGTFSAADVAANKDTDNATFEVPSASSIAGDDLPVRLKVRDGGSGGWEVDKTSSVAPLNLVRKTDFISGTTRNKLNGSPEPYTCGESIKVSGKLLIASWTSKKYVPYANRNVHVQARTDGGVQPLYVTEEEQLSNSSGNITVYLGTDPGDELTCESRWIVRGKYNGNGTASGNWSTGDGVLLAA